MKGTFKLSLSNYLHGYMQGQVEGSAFVEQYLGHLGTRDHIYI